MAPWETTAILNYVKSKPVAGVTVSSMRHYLWHFQKKTIEDVQAEFERLVADGLITAEEIPASTGPIRPGRNTVPMRLYRPSAQLLLGNNPVEKTG